MSIKPPTEAELELWRALATRALAVAERPRGEIATLRQARKATLNKIVPSPPPTRDHPFVRLARVVDRFLAESPAGREDMAQVVIEVGRLCIAHLDAADARAVRMAGGAP